ncbi:MAG: hypothetical protein HFG97_09555 [Dorea sp.]|nr:hypothetical protein [Dorea sp.]
MYNRISKIRDDFKLDLDDITLVDNIDFFPRISLVQTGIIYISPSLQLNTAERLPSIPVFCSSTWRFLPPS